MVSFENPTYTNAPDTLVSNPIYSDSRAVDFDEDSDMLEKVLRSGCCSEAHLLQHIGGEYDVAVVVDPMRVGRGFDESTVDYLDVDQHEVQENDAHVCLSGFKIIVCML